mgnify:FL=1
MTCSDRLAVLQAAANWCRHVSGVRVSFTLSALFSTILGFMLMLGSPQAANAAITDCTDMVSPNEYALA